MIVEQSQQQVVYRIIVGGNYWYSLQKTIKTFHTNKIFTKKHDEHSRSN